MEIYNEKVVLDVMNLIKEKVQNLKKLNIIVAGKTGVGKSTLINSVFKEHLANEGIGKPVTDHIREITSPNLPLSIYDTRGLELGEQVQKQVKNEILSAIDEGNKSQDINKMIHCIWYCINTATNRIEPEEIEWLKTLTSEKNMADIPVIVVLTQSISKSKAGELRKIILDENLNIKQVVPVLARNYEIDDDYVAKAYGLEELIKVMGKVLPNELIDTLHNVQIACLAEKRNRSQMAVAAAAASATAEGAIPIPFADAAVLVPTQVAMMASISVIYGLSIDQGVLTTLISATIGAGGATILGKTIVANIFKLIPGAGSVVGGVISGSVAGLITAALGEVYIQIMEMIAKGEMSPAELSTEKGKKLMTDLYINSLKGKK